MPVAPVARLVLMQAGAAGGIAHQASCGMGHSNHSQQAVPGDQPVNRRQPASIAVLVYDGAAVDLG